MLYLPESDITFLQIGHCGTNWLRHALSVSGVKWRKWGNDHDLETENKDRTVTFIRHPVPWLRAIWNHRTDGNRWGVTGDIPDAVYTEAKDLSHFMLVLAEKHPGYCGDFLGNYVQKSSRICRIECASFDLVKTLEFFGQVHSASHIYLTRPVKMTRKERKIEAKAIQAILQSEKETIQRYRY